MKISSISTYWTLAAGALGALYACSDGASSAGAPGLGEAGGAGGDAGAPSQGGSQSEGGMGGDEGSAAGAAGSPEPVPKAGERCLACLADPTNSATGTACAVLAHCEASAPCKAWLDCVAACDDDACAASCDADHSEVAPYYYQVYDCLCSSCDAQCSPIAACEHGCVDDESLLPLATAPATLAETGLYLGGGLGSATWQIAPYAREFQPEYVLWSDGAEKKRWAYIPKCGRIDTSDMDHWDFPVGTRFWKQFTIPSSGVAGSGTRVETRLIHRFGPGAEDWTFAAYQWPMTDEVNLEDPTTAVFVPDGVVNANGTMHDIPAVPACRNCHTKLSERILSFSAIQLSHALPGETIEQLSERGWLSVPAPNGFDPPGDATAKAALGYLHANCGNCHNDAFSPVEPAPRMRLLVAHDTVQATDTYTSLVGIPTVSLDFDEYDRIEPGLPESSEIIVRMGIRAPVVGQMPPIATKVAHNAGIEAVSNWISTLPLDPP